MKLMYAECCQSVVVPHPMGFVRKCSCGYSAVCWDNPYAGTIAVCRARPDVETSANGIWIIGLHNQVFSRRPLSREGIQEILEATPDTYLFKFNRSLVVKIMPGTTSDTRYGTLQEMHSRTQLTERMQPPDQQS